MAQHIANAAGQAINPATQDTLAEVSQAIGTTTDVAVTTDDDGTIQQYLRGLAKNFLAKVGFDDTDKLAVSLYGKGAAEGDTPLTMAAPGEPNLRVSIMQGSTQLGIRSFAEDGLSNSRGRAEIEASGLLFNGVSWDRARGNVEETLLASAARADATPVSVNLTNYNHRGILLVIDVTARAAATTLTPKLTLKTPVAGTYDIDFWTAAAAIDTANGTVAYLFYPAETPVGITFTEEINVTLPRSFRLTITPSDANSVTYSAGVYYLL